MYDVDTLAVNDHGSYPLPAFCSIHSRSVTYTCPLRLILMLPSLLANNLHLRKLAAAPRSRIPVLVPVPVPDCIEYSKRASLSVERSIDLLLFIADGSWGEAGRASEFGTSTLPCMG